MQCEYTKNTREFHILKLIQRGRPYLREEWACGDEDDDEGRRGGGLHLRSKWPERWWFSARRPCPDVTSATGGVRPDNSGAVQPLSPHKELVPPAVLAAANSWFSAALALKLFNRDTSEHNQRCLLPMAPSRTLSRMAQPASPPLLLGPRHRRSSPLASAAPRPSPLPLHAFERNSPHACGRRRECAVIPSCLCPETGRAAVLARARTAAATRPFPPPLLASDAESSSRVRQPEGVRREGLRPPASAPRR